MLIGKFCGFFTCVMGDHQKGREMIPWQVITTGRRNGSDLVWSGQGCSDAGNGPAVVFQIAFLSC